MRESDGLADYLWIRLVRHLSNAGENCKIMVDFRFIAHMIVSGIDLHKEYSMSNEMEDMSQARSYFKANRDKFAHYAAKQRDKLKLEMVAAYGGKCVHCDIDDPVVLSLDHKDDDAHIEKELYGLNARGGHKNYQRLKKDGWPQERFQLLCYNCNARKEHTRRRNEMEDRWGPVKPADRVLVQAGILMKSHNTSGIKGVFWNTQKSRWQAKITIGGKAVHLGFFTDMREAAVKYRDAAIEIWGQHANVQSIEEIDKVVLEMENSAEEPVASTASELGL